jgi:hypothetical protein
MDRFTCYCFRVTNSNEDALMARTLSFDRQKSMNSLVDGDVETFYDVTRFELQDLLF